MKRAAHRSRPPGVTLVLELETEGFDADVVVYRADGYEAEMDEVAAAAGVRLEHRIGASGYWHFLVRARGPGEEGRYRLRVSLGS